MEKYAFGDIIGHGNYGTCHVVTHKKENRHYVAKRIPVHDVAARGEALAEAQLLSKIKHPNVIAYKESFLDVRAAEEETAETAEDVVANDAERRLRRERGPRLGGGDCLCIVTAYAEEGDLFTHIKRARESKPRRYFPERQVLDWTAQIALALDHIHAMRVMHRDLKTQNIFLGRGGVVKLGDFGISRVLERTDDFATTVAGTPYYLSPEVCQNQPYTLKSDVWSFGCVAYEMATLEHAFAADSLLSLVYRIVNGTCDYSEIRERYDARFCALIESMLERDSERRPSVASVLRSEIMQDHLRRMQRDGLGRPRSAAAPPPRPLIQRASRVPPDAQRLGPVSASPRVAPIPPSAMTPREAAAARRREAAEARGAVLAAAAAERTDLSKEAFRREFHGGKNASSSGSVDASVDAVDTGERSGSGSGTDADPFESDRSDRSDCGWEDEVAEYALQETGGSFGLRSLTGFPGDVADSLESLRTAEPPPERGSVSGDGRESTTTPAGVSSDPERKSSEEPVRDPVDASGFVFSPPAADPSAPAGPGTRDAKEDTFAGGFASGVGSEEMCFSPPPRSDAVRVPDAAAFEKDRVRFAPGAARYDEGDGVTDSDAGGSLGSFGLGASSRSPADAPERRGLDPAFAGAIPETPSWSNPEDASPVPDASWLDSTLPDAPLSPAQTDMEMDVLAALTLDAEADVRAEEEVSLVTAFAAQNINERGGDGGDGAFGEAPTNAPSSTFVPAYDHDDAPRIARDADSERAVLLEAAKSLDNEDAGAMRDAATKERSSAEADPPRDCTSPVASGSDRVAAGSISVPREQKTRASSDEARSLPAPPADDSVVAARAHKVSRLRLMCGAQLGEAFADVHAFLRSARRRRADDAEVKRRLMRLVKNDGAKLAACFAVDMLCFEEEHLFSELEQVRAPGTYAPGVNVFVDDSKEKQRNGDPFPSDKGRSGSASSSASSAAQSPRTSSPHTALPGGGLDRHKPFKATAAEREKARKRISLPGA